MSISLNDHENRIKAVELQLPDIENRIANIISTAKKYTILTVKISVPNSSGSVSIPSEYANSKIALLSCNVDGTKYGHNSGGSVKYRISCLISNNNTSSINLSDCSSDGGSFYINKNATTLTFGMTNGFYATGHDKVAVVMLYI